MAVQRDQEGRLVLVKRAGPGAGAERLRREAAALRVGAGAGCVELLELGDGPDGGVRLVTAWVGGGSLAIALPLGPARLVAIARVLAGHLAALHARGLVHGRLVPEHVLLDGDRPVLCGFAAARLPGEEGRPSPVDDVAALLALLDELAGDAGGAVADGLRAVVAAGPAGGAAAVADRLAALAPGHGRPRREVPPRRPSPERRPPVRGLVTASAGAVVLLALAAAVWRDAGSAPNAPPRPATTEPACPTAGTDLDGDGCAEHVDVRGAVVTAGERRWQVGAGGDLSAVADWDCDGRATAAVVRPSTGEVWVYDGWAAAGRPVTARPGPPAPGARTVRAVPDQSGCARLEVTTTGGERRRLDLH